MTDDRSVINNAEGDEMGNLATVISFGVALMPYLVDYVWAQQELVRGKENQNTPMTLLSIQ